MIYLRALLVGLILLFVATFGVFVVEPMIGRMGEESRFVFVASGFALGGVVCLLYRVFARIADGPRRASAAPNPFLEQRRIDERKRARQGRSAARPEPPEGGATIYRLKSVPRERPRKDAPDPQIRSRGP
jgi:hypothetical protein